jgi:CheY-like chemotaxis protein
MQSWQIDQDARRAAPVSAEGADSPALGRLRILVVDDNVDSAETMAVLLSHGGHEVRTAHDGGEAVNVAEEFTPQVILLDIGLPVRSGHEVARELRKKPWAAGVKIIAMSGWGQDADRKSSREAGFDHHLVKPIDHAELRRLLALADGAGHERSSSVVIVPGSTGFTR